MSIKITKCNHVTQTEKKHLNAFIESGLTSAKVNRKFYEILKGTKISNGWEYEIRITTPRKDDFGRPTADRQTVTLQKI